MIKNDLPTPEDFEQRRFAENNKQLFDEYIELVVRGVDHQSALRLTFGEAVAIDQFTWARIFALQRNPYYKTQFKRRLDSIEMNELWNPKLAVHNLVKLALDPGAKETARLNAMKELNLIIGITVVDENGTTKLGRNMDDFYTQLQAKTADLHYPPASGGDPTKH